jgi:hypothetical protein
MHEHQTSFMKPNILNTILKILFLLAVGICAWLVIGLLLGLAAGNRPSGSDLRSWAGAFAGSGVLTLFVYVVWQSVGILLRVEAQQERMALAVEALSRRMEELSDKTHAA